MYCLRLTDVVVQITPVSLSKYLTHRMNTGRCKSNLYIISNQIVNSKKEPMKDDETNPSERAVTLGKG